MHPFLRVKTFSDDIVAHWHFDLIRQYSSTLFFSFFCQLNLSFLYLFNVRLQRRDLLQKDALVVPMLDSFALLLTLTEVATVLLLFKGFVFFLQKPDASIELLQLLERWSRLRQIIVVFELSDEGHFVFIINIVWVLVRVIDHLAENVLIDLAGSLIIFVWIVFADDLLTKNRLEMLWWKYPESEQTEDKHLLLSIKAWYKSVFARCVRAFVDVEHFT